jgi:hypothetical protein
VCVFGKCSFNVGMVTGDWIRGSKYGNLVLLECFLCGILNRNGSIKQVKKYYW